LCRSLKLVLSSALHRRLILFGYVLLNMYLKKIDLFFCCWWWWFCLSFLATVLTFCNLIVAPVLVYSEVNTAEKRIIESAELKVL
jgi:hypothetical protein